MGAREGWNPEKGIFSDWEFRRKGEPMMRVAVFGALGIEFFFFPAKGGGVSRMTEMACLRVGNGQSNIDRT